MPYAFLDRQREQEDEEEEDELVRQRRENLYRKLISLLVGHELGPGRIRRQQSSQEEEEALYKAYVNVWDPEGLVENAFQWADGRPWQTRALWLDQFASHVAEARSANLDVWLLNERCGNPFASEWLEHAEAAIEKRAGVQTKLALLKPDVMRIARAVDEIMAHLQSEGFAVELRAHFTFSEPQAREFYSHASVVRSFDEVARYLSGGESMLLLLRRRNAFQAWRQMLNGQKGSPLAGDAARDDGSVHLERRGFGISMRELYGADPARGQNALHGATCASEVARQRRALRFVPAVRLLRKARQVAFVRTVGRMRRFFVQLHDEVAFRPRHSGAARAATHFQVAAAAAADA